MNKLTEQELNELHNDVYHATRNLWQVLVTHHKLENKDGASHFFEGAWAAHDSLRHLAEYLECGIPTTSTQDPEAKHWEDLATYNERHSYDNDDFDYED